LRIDPSAGTQAGVTGAWLWVVRIIIVISS